MDDVFSVTVSDGLATLTINNPPVNALSYKVRQVLLDTIDESENDVSVTAILISSRGKMFSAGADIREFDNPVIEPGLPGLIDRIESCMKPVVVALFGTTLGGGFELAMGCHYRIATPDTRVGLPEVHIGLIPGAGGTQRLPRLIGAQAALEAITSGRHIPAGEAHELGAIDEIAEGDLMDAARHAANRLVATTGEPRRTGALDVDPQTIPEGLFATTKATLAKRRRGFDAPQAAVDAVEWACTDLFVKGLEKERACSAQLKASVQSKAQRHLFFAERTALKVPDVPKDTPLRPIHAAGVVGAGTMGSGIALNFLNAEIPITLVEAKEDALQAGVDRIRKTLDRDVTRQRLSPDERDRRLGHLNGVLDFAALAKADVVIEAVFESMDLKKQVFAELDRICRPDAILATNTSTLDIDDIAAQTGHPDRVIGTHFFSPANVMKLLEVVRGAATAKDVIATTMALGRRIGKTPVLSGNAFAFIGNRMLEDYVRESQMLLLEGASPDQVDGVLEHWGMAMGPCAVMDLAGQDVSFLTRDQNRHHLPDDPLYYRPGDLMNEMGRFGQKTGKGFYRYADGRTRQNDPEAVSLIRDAAQELDVKQRSDLPEQEILDRCLCALINRGAQLLDEDIALRSSDIDLVWTAGYGFPTYRGGPMFYGDTVGLNTVIDVFDQYAETFGNDYGYWTPAPLLVELASEGKTFADFDAARREST